MQGAIHEQVFDVLQCTFPSHPWLEGFASPFNAFLTSFGSAFPDLDWHFGSMGNFMDFSFGQQDCCCEVNPPFSPGIMNGMADHIENQLSKAEEKDVSLTFVVIVPTANDNDDAATVKQAASISFQRMLSSAYCRKHIRLAAREHGYLEGSQHLRPTQYKQSAYDTSVILLQSPKASQQEPNGQADIMKTLEKDLKVAFTSRHEQELNERRKSAKDQN
jgi:phosphorylated CTD-interacting factor 1